MTLKTRPSKLFIIFILILGLVCTHIYPISASTATSTASAYDVYISGNFMEGETLTAHYTYYDPMGLPEVTENVQYQWYAMNRKDGTLAELTDATGVTYTIKEGDGGATSNSQNFIFVKVTTANANGLGTGVYSDLTLGSSYDHNNKNGASVFADIGGYIAPQNPTGSMKVGDTLVARFAYRNNTEVTDTEAFPDKKYVPEGASTYKWQTKDTVTGEATVVQNESTDNTYTLTDADFGKVIECVITPIAADGTVGTSYTAVNHYGNLFYGNKATVTDATNSFIAVAANLPAIEIIRDKGGFQLYSATKKSSFELVVDVGSLQTFDGIFLRTSIGEGITAYYSSTGTEDDWTQIPGTITAKEDCELKLDNPAVARYFKLSASFATSTAFSVYGFYPYLTANALPKLTLSGSESMELFRSQSYEEPGFAAYSSTGEDISDQVVVEGTVNSNVLGEYTIEYSLSVEGYPTVKATRVVSVKEGIQSEGDLAFGKTVTANCGNNAENLCDGNPYSVWALDKTTGNATIDLGSVQGISKILIDEAGENVSSYTVSASTDNEKWTKFLEGTDITGEIVDFTPVEARYVRLEINDASVNPSITTVELHSTKTAEVYLAREKLTIGEDLTSVTEDLALPIKGAYDVNIEWSSSNPDVINADGVVKRGSENEAVTLTATLSNEEDSLSKTFEVTVAKKEKSSSNSGGGGGSRSSGGKTTSISMPAIYNTSNSLPTPTMSSGKFSDVAAGHWASEYINALATDGVIKGRSETEFAPDGNITRAEFLKLLFEIFDLKAETNVAEFTDVSADDWYYSYVAGGAALGIVGGKGDGTFAPNESILRRDMAVMVDKVLNVIGLSLREAESATELKDSDAIADYAKEAVIKLSRSGIISGNENGEFMPKASVTRAQAAKIIYMLRAQR